MHLHIYFRTCSVPLFFIFYHRHVNVLLNSHSHSNGFVLWNSHSTNANFSWLRHIPSYCQWSLWSKWLELSVCQYYANVWLYWGPSRGSPRDTQFKITAWWGVGVRASLTCGPLDLIRVDENSSQLFCGTKWLLYTGVSVTDRNLICTVCRIVSLVSKLLGGNFQGPHQIRYQAPVSSRRAWLRSTFN